MISTERKISLPAYKLAYAFCFVVILSLIRGISLSYEIGVAMEAPMAVLAMVFCADTYTQEITSKRSEVHRLYPLKRRIRSISMRMIAQEIVLFILSAIGYGMFFFFQNTEGFQHFFAHFFHSPITSRALSFRFKSILTLKSKKR